MTTREPNPHWIDVRQQRPQGEVLAINAQDDLLVGYVSLMADGDYVVEADGYTLKWVTHWMDLGELQVLRRLQFPE